MFFKGNKGTGALRVPPNHYFSCYFYFFQFLRSRSLRIQVEVATGLRPEDRNYVCVWLVLYLLKIWGTVRVFIVIDRPDIAYTNGDILFTLLNIQCLFTSAQAFANCILFCFCDGVVRRHFCRGCRDREEGRPLLANA